MKSIFIKIKHIIEWSKSELFRTFLVWFVITWTWINVNIGHVFFLALKVFSLNCCLFLFWFIIRFETFNYQHDCENRKKCTSRGHCENYHVCVMFVLFELFFKVFFIDFMQRRCEFTCDRLSWIEFLRNFL